MSEFLLDLHTERELGRVRVNGVEHAIQPLTVKQRARLIALAMRARKLASVGDDDDVPVEAAAEAFDVGREMVRMAIPTLPPETIDALPVASWTRLVDLVRSLLDDAELRQEDAARTHPLRSDS